MPLGMDAGPAVHHQESFGVELMLVDLHSPNSFPNLRGPLKRWARISRAKLVGSLLVAALPSGALVNAAINPSDPADASDPFQQYLTGKPPNIVRIVGEETNGSVQLKRVVFYSRTVPTKPKPQRSEVFALIARPSAPGRYPGLLILHGGRGAAEQAKAIAWAARGYIVVAPDLPGIAEPASIPYSSGPWKGDYTGRYISATPDVTASPIFDGVLAAVQALYLLRAQPDVISDRVGVVGISWGGYAATMVCGLGGDAVRAAFSVYGSGFYDRGSGWQERLSKLSTAERAAWLKYLDAGRRTPGITANYFVAAATNDSYYWPPAVMATLEKIRSPKNHLFAANAVHSAPVPGGTRPPTEVSPNWLDMEVDYFAFHLKGEGQPFPSITVENSGPAGSKGTRLRFRVKGVVPLKGAAVFYSATDQSWPQRTWISARAVPLGGGFYEAVIPAAAAARGADWFASASDTRPVTVSSNIVQIRTPTPTTVNNPTKVP